MNKIITITGPTASGKTRLGVELALALNGEVVSADSMQVYRGMDIGTAKPTMEERRGVPHHMLDVAQPEESYSVARYVEQATPIVDALLERGKVPVLVGGTGLYVDSLCAGRRFERFDPQVRARLEERAHAQGMDALLTQLRRVDPESAASLSVSDAKRIIRALEVWEQTGKPLSLLNRESRTRPPRYEAVNITLSFAQRDRLRARIDARVDEMLERGLLDEIEGLLRRGVPERCTSMQAIGYKEFLAALRGECSVAQSARLVKLRSGQYAKRQLTWFRRNPAAHWFLWDERPNFDAALRFATEIAHRAGIH